MEVDAQTSACTAQFVWASMISASGMACACENGTAAVNTNNNNNNNTNNHEDIYSAVIMA